jgi:hypothetical protein
METLEKANEVTPKLNIEDCKRPSHSETKEDLPEDPEEIFNTPTKDSENLFKFNIEKVESINSNDLSEIQLNQIYVKLSEIKNKIDCAILSSDKPSPPSLQEKIIPNKLKSMNGFLFFTYCKVNEFKIPSNIYNANTGVNPINSNINTNDFKITNKIKDFNFLIMKDENRFILNSSDLNFKIPSLNFGTLAGYKFFSNFSVVDFENEQPLIVFLVVYNYVCVLKIYNNSNTSSENNTGKNEKKFDILFQREFSNSNLLLFLGSEEVSKKYHKFYILSKPGQKMILFHCKYKKKLNKIKVTFEEKNLENSLKLPTEKILKSETKENENCLNNNNMLQLSRVIVTNSTEIFFYDKPTNKIYLMNKYKFNKIKALNNNNVNSDKSEKSSTSITSDLGDWKNFLVVADKQQEVSNLYLITDELINSSNTGSSILIKIWKIKNNFNESKPEKPEKPTKDIQFENIEYEKIQTIQIKSKSMEDSQGIGMYNFTTIDEFHFSLCLYEHDEILIFKMKSFPSQDSAQPAQSNFLIESIYELNFQELYACMFDYQILSDNILELVLYQEEEFLKYEIDLKKGIKNSKVSVLEFSNGKSNSDKNFKTASNKNNLNLNSKNKSIAISSIIKNSDNPSPTSTNSNNIQIPMSSSLGEGEAGDTKTLILDFKKSLSEKIITGIETKLDKLINSKMNMFAEGLNSKLSDVFSFMKKQTEDLEDIRKRNNDAMVNVTNLILKAQENVKSKNNNNLNNLNLYNTNPKLYSYMMNLGLNQNVMSMINSQSNNNNLSLQNDLTKRTQNLQNQPIGQFNINPNPNNNIKNQSLQNPQNQPNILSTSSQGNMNLVANNNQNMPPYNFHPVNTQNILRTNQLYQNYAVGYSPNTNNLFPNSGNQYLNYNLQNLQNFNTTTLTGNCEMPTDNKYKEDQLVLEIMEKKFSEIKNEEEQLMKSILEGEINLSLDFKKETKEVMNYSSDSKK